MSSNRPNRASDALADYVPVAERIEKFHHRYPEGRILTSIVEHDTESGFILMRAEVYRNADDAAPAATGHAFEVRGESYVNKTSYVENCETGACGRALALLGFEVKRGLASREEMEKSNRTTRTESPRAEVAAPQTSTATTKRGANAPSNTSNNAISNVSANDGGAEESRAVSTAATPTLAAPSADASGRLPNVRPAAVGVDADALANDEQKSVILELLEALRPDDRKAQRALLVQRTGKSSRDDLTAQEAKRLIEALRGK